MKNKKYIEIGSVSIVLILLLALYVQNYNLKSHIGQSDFDNLNFMYYKLGVLTETLEEEELTSYMVSSSMEEVQSIAYRANIGSAYFRTVFEGNRDLDRIQNDSEYREMIIVRLKAYNNALGEVLKNADEYREKHFFGKAKVYYDYISQEPRLTEILEEKFNEELEKIGSVAAP